MRPPSRARCRTRPRSCGGAYADPSRLAKALADAVAGGELWFRQRRPSRLSLCASAPSNRAFRMNAPVLAPSILEASGVDAAPRPRHPRRRPGRAPTTASCSSSAPRVGGLRVRRRAAEVGHLRLRPRASACAWWPARPPATPMPARSPRRRSARAAKSAALAKRGYAGVAGRGAARHQRQALRRRRPARLARLLRQGRACCRRSTPSPAPRDPRVVQVMASLAGERRIVEILRADGRLIRDVRPLVRLNVQVTVEKDGRRENGFVRRRRPRRLRGLDHARTSWQEQVDEALRQALVNLDAVACPAGEMDVVLGAGLERRAAARGGRPRPGGRLQPQGHQRLLRPHRRAGGLARRHRVRRRHDLPAAAAR